MKKNLRNFCNGVDSTSTVNQHRADRDLSCVADPSFLGSNSPHPTLEEMIFQLELEEEAARRPKLWEYGRRTSCVNNSDVLRSARSALNQYPRFSLDGRDAMYRSSFRNLGFEGGRKSVCSSAGHMGRLCRDVYGDLDSARRVALPSVLAGESVVWCKPGVVAKLMGLEAMPMPINKRQRSKERFSCMVKKEGNIRMFERCELEKGRLLSASMQRCRGKGKESSGLRRRSDVGSRVMEAVAMEPVKRRDGWRTGPTR